MKKLTCEMCGGTNLIKENGVFVCQNCGVQYSLEDAKNMMIEGVVDVQGTVKLDNSAFIERSLQNARRALNKEDWEEVEKYYNLVEQNAPNNMEAVFFSSYGKARISLLDNDYNNYGKRIQRGQVLINSISVISDYYELTVENKEEVLIMISDYIDKILQIKDRTYSISEIRIVFLTELKQIQENHDDKYIKDLIQKNSESQTTAGGCYVATAVYGSYDCPQVWVLRRYRDYNLAKTWYGRTFIHMYYAISPTIVKWFGNKNWFKKIWKRKLDCMVENLKSDGFKDTEYEDINW